VSGREAASAPNVDPAAAAAEATAAPAPPTALQRHGRLLLVGVAAVALVALLWPRGDGSKAAPGGFLVDAGGRPAPLGERLTPVTLLHFYASWCPPCLDEAPSLVRLEKDLAGEPRFRVVKVAVEDDIQRAQALAGSEDVLFDPKWETAHRYGTRALPESYLIVGGKVQRKFDGPQNWDDPQLRDALQQAIARVASTS
jgi:thiol-disulfide isomerase/thioredoxin